MELDADWRHKLTVSLRECRFPVNGRYYSKMSHSGQARADPVTDSMWSIAALVLLVAALPWSLYWSAPKKLRLLPDLDFPHGIRLSVGQLRETLTQIAAAGSVLIVPGILAFCFVVAFGSMFAVVFGRAYWPSKSARSIQPSDVNVIVASLIVVVSFLTIVGCFAACYMQIAAEHHDCFRIVADNRHVLRHAEGLYFAITTFTTTGFGDIIATSKVCRLVVAGQTLVGLSILTFVIAGLTGRAIAHFSDD